MFLAMTGAGAGAGATTGTGSPWVSIIMMVAIIAIFYFLMIRPQNKKAKQVKEMLDNLQVGNRVRTIGGLYGTVAEIKDDDIVVVEFGYENKVKIAFARSAIAQVNDEGVEADEVKDEVK
jgi:preprotein translocase subunit YajC